MFWNKKKLDCSVPQESLNNGNQVFLDQMVVDELKSMADQPNIDREKIELSQWIIRLINRYAQNEYSLKALRQIQRFFFLWYEDIIQLGFEKFCVMIEDCIPPDGAESEGFDEIVEIFFGWSRFRNYAYIFSDACVSGMV